MVQYFQRLRQQLDDEKGAEIVEWVMWVGGIALLAGAMYLAVSTALNGTIQNVIGTIGPLSSS